MSVVSFGFKHGVPWTSTTCSTVRFLPNPHWVEELRPLTGLDEPVRRVRAGPARRAGVPPADGRPARVPPAGLREGGEVVPHAWRSVVPGGGTGRWCWPRSWPGASGTGASTRSSTTGTSQPMTGRRAGPPAGPQCRRPRRRPRPGHHPPGGPPATPAQVTAVVSVADDGGSSGRLRGDRRHPRPGRPAPVPGGPGDPTTPCGPGPSSTASRSGDLEGHALGNLIIAGLANVTGDFGPALDRGGRPARGRGRVAAGDRRAGGPQGRRGRGRGRRPGPCPRRPAPSRVRSSRPTPRPRPRRWTPSRGADQVIIGPGSLYTSVLAVCAVPAIRGRWPADRRPHLRLQPPPPAARDRRLRRRRPRPGPPGPRRRRSTSSSSPRPCRPAARRAGRGAAWPT